MAITGFEPVLSTLLDQARKALRPLIGTQDIIINEAEIEGPLVANELRVDSTRCIPAKSIVKMTEVIQTDAGFTVFFLQSDASSDRWKAFLQGAAVENVEQDLSELRLGATPVGWSNFGS